MLKTVVGTYTVNFDDGSYNVDNYNASAFRSVDTFSAW